ncbi:YbfB/YjiJ family MFS transporter [Ideonella paludis]|uniref:YbfB/YjiJ family MFS transporter n=1 Tax=Ideonella paludis TaxID=1233411 RepID=UPI0036419439
MGSLSTSSSALKPWQVITGGICGLVLTIGLARFAYTPLLPALQAQTGLSDAAAGGLAAVNYAGYMSGALAAAWIDDARWRHRLYSAGLWMALLCTALMAVSAWWPAWALWRYLGGLCGATGMLLGSGLVLGWLMRQGRRPELGLHFIGLGLGILVSAVGAWVLQRVWPLWSSQWLALAVLGLVFLCRLGPGARRCRRRWPPPPRKPQRPPRPSAGCGPWPAATLRRAGAL